MTPDTTGLELPDFEAARRVAVRSALAIMQDGIAGGKLDLTAYIDIKTGAGDALGRVRFVDLVQIAY